AWHHLTLETEGSTFKMPQTWVRIRPMEQVPHVDAAAIISDRNDEIILFVVNRDLKSAHTLKLDVGWEAGKVESSVLLQYGDSPFLRHTHWYEQSGYHFLETKLTPGPNESSEITLPAGSVARVSFRLLNR
ncbi:MAG: alpha-L-arabinofuranosidase domain protein, partial [Paenibacillus sp.]|nr:alpha-L-arabinofuranosidase domain protein [Paenibacillus sp.]